MWYQLNRTSNFVLNLPPDELAMFEEGEDSIGLHRYSHSDHLDNLYYLEWNDEGLDYDAMGLYLKHSTTHVAFTILMQDKHGMDYMNCTFGPGYFTHD